MDPDLTRRLDLATARDGKFREIKYVIEIDELEQVILRTLNRIQKRDGAKVFKEVSRWLQHGLDEMIAER
jgi:nucleoside-triphosphatase THEP1